MRVTFLNCNVDDVTLAESVVKIEEIIKKKQPSQHITIDPSKINAMQKDLSLRLIVNKSPLINTASPVILYASKVLKRPLHQIVSTKLLFIELLKKCEEHGYRPYFFGSKDTALEGAVNYIKKMHPTIDIAGCSIGYLKREDPLEVVKEIQKSQADILFVAFPSPQKEYWIDEYINQLKVPFVMGVGVGFDVLADEIKTTQLTKISKKIRRFQPKNLFEKTVLFVYTLKARVKSQS